jgi:hypothetical protein
MAEAVMPVLLPTLLVFAGIGYLHGHPTHIAEEKLQLGMNAADYWLAAVALRAQGGRAPTLKSTTAPTLRVPACDRGPSYGTQQFASTPVHDRWLPPGFPFRSLQPERDRYHAVHHPGSGFK